MKTQKRSKLIYNFFWRFGERIVSQLVMLVVSIILARILTPDDFGTVAIVSVFIVFANVFVTDGLSTALIQRKDASQKDFSTLFYVNLLLSIILYIIMFLLAPLVSKFYSIEILTPALRVLSIQIPLSSIGAIQQAYVIRNMMFKKFFYATIVGTIVSAIIGIAMALSGFGIWALIAQQLTKKLIDDFVLWIIVKWRPRLEFSVSNLRELLKYGSNILVANLIVTTYNEIRSVVIGRLYSPADLAFYNKGKQFPGLIESNTTATISSVLFPVLSRSQSSPESVKEITRKSIRIGSYVIWPLMIGLAVLAKPLVILVLTDKWIDSVIYLQVYCIIYGLMPLQTANMQAIKAIGNSDTYMKMEVLKRIIGITLLFLIMRISITAIVISNLITSILFSIINSYPNRFYINYTYQEQLKDMLPSFILSLAMGIVVYCVNLLISSNVLKIFVGAIVGLIFYLGVSILTKNEDLKYLFNTLRN
jgi:O-antigen/teichoic acid export membrane protein